MFRRKDDKVIEQNACQNCLYYEYDDVYSKMYCSNRILLDYRWYPIGSVRINCLERACFKQAPLKAKLIDFFRRK